jgi:hypothetical protein
MQNPKSFAHICAHSLGGSVRDGGHDHEPIAFDDPRYFSQHASPPRERRAKGGPVRDRAGHRIFSER